MLLFAFAKLRLSLHWASFETQTQRICLRGGQLSTDDSTLASRRNCPCLNLIIPFFQMDKLSTSLRLMKGAA